MYLLGSKERSRVINIRKSVYGLFKGVNSFKFQIHRSQRCTPIVLHPLPKGVCDTLVACMCVSSVYAAL